VQGFFKRDHASYRDYAERSRTVDGYEAWLKQWVLEVPDRATYMSRIDVDSLRISRHRMSEPVDYGDE
jgi:glutaconate CoA-transferase subunit A